MFIDEVTVKLIAGKGGDGCTSFRHEKYVDLGGPDGGNGGNGGDIIFKTDTGLNTLIDLKYKKTIKSDKGSNGEGSNKTGARGEDLIVKVPVGTVVKDEDNNLLCDLVMEKQEYIVAKGGKGGRGNYSFKSNKNKAPLTSEYGLNGEEKIIKCELKLLADVGLVGLPSVGKSSIISIISNSKPKIAEYEFTTLTPNLGVVKYNDKSFVVADLPGLIKGASKGVGLGDKFLRHIERTKIICHVLDMSDSNVLDNYLVIRKELESYSKKLINKEELIVANKMDLEGSDENLKTFRNKYKDKEIIAISAIKKDNIDTLIYKLGQLVEKHKEETPVINESHKTYKYENKKPFEIIKQNNTYIIKGEEIETLLKKTKFNSDEDEIRFANILKKKGIDEELEKAGIKEGDIVKILDFELEYRKGL